MINIFIEPIPLFRNKVQWTLTIIGQCVTQEYTFVDRLADAQVTIGSDDSYDIKVDTKFFRQLENDQTKWKDVLTDEPIIKSEDGRKCIIETIFYLVNCIQELNLDTSEVDQFGRFKYQSSLQHHYGIVEDNYVGTLINDLVALYPKLISDDSPKVYPTKAFISHDIDLLKDGWKIESYLAISSLQVKLILNVGKGIIQRDKFYDNIHDVILLDKKYNVPSTFYWLPAKGKDKNGLMNADYDLQSLSKNIKLSSSMGCVNGIHKSSFVTSFDDELSLFPYPLQHNRYHYLKCDTHAAWREIQHAGLKTEASLGFAEHIGFRNSYGLPFTPFDMQNDRPYSFVVIPLHVMDVTLFNYMGLAFDDVLDRWKRFYKKNMSNALISILWHNNMLTKWTHEDKATAYRKILSEIAENDIKCVTAGDIYDEFLMQ